MLFEIILFKCSSVRFIFLFLSSEINISLLIILFCCAETISIIRDPITLSRIESDLVSAKKIV